MTTQEFDMRMLELQAMVGMPVEDLFADEYARLLDDILADDAEQRHERAARMKALLMKQAQWLMNAWLREHGTGGGLDLAGMVRV
jgi:hypothetical protein